MSNKPQMMVFGEDWGGLPSSTQHLIRQLDPHYQITWINSLGLRSPRASIHDIKRIFAKLGRMVKQRVSPSPKAAVAAKAEPISDTFEVVEPQYLPFPGNPLARQINRRLLAKLLKSHVKNGLSQRPVIWISLPNAVDALYHLQDSALNDAAVIYYCCDDFSALSGVDHVAIGQLEQELAERADVIVATSDDLVKKFPQGKTHMIPHGVDVGLFRHAVERAADLPNGKPVAGFYGSIAPWINLELLQKLAQTLNDWHFVFIGNAQVDVSSLQALDNVTFLGPKPHHELPRYSQHWQVSLLPFHLNEQIMACNPLKLREYLAAGKPIVSVDFPEVRKYSEFVYLAEGAEGFAAAMRQSLQETPQLVQKRQQKVENESWAAVAGQIDQLIGRH